MVTYNCTFADMNWGYFIVSKELLLRGASIEENSATLILNQTSEKCVELLGGTGRADCMGGLP